MRSLSKHRLRGVVHKPGDLVLTHIPRVKKGVTTRLRYQTVGPFEVLPHTFPPTASNGSYNVYNLRHLGTGAKTTVNVRQIMPYVSRSAHEADCPNDANATSPAVQPLPFNPQSNSFVLLPNEGGQAYQLLRIVSRDGDAVTAQYLNTTDKKRLKHFRLVWQHDTKSEIQSNRKPSNKGYRAWTDHFATADFNQREASPVQIGTGANGNHFNLSAAEVQATLKAPAL